MMTSRQAALSESAMTAAKRYGAGAPSERVRISAGQLARALERGEPGIVSTEGERHALVTELRATPGLLLRSADGDVQFEPVTDDSRDEVVARDRGFRVVQVGAADAVFVWTHEDDVHLYDFDRADPEWRWSPNERGAWRLCVEDNGLSLNGSAPVQDRASVESKVDSEPPVDEKDFDGYVAREGWHKIEDVATMERFLRRAAGRYHALDAAWTADCEQLTPTQQRAWSILEGQFVGEGSDLRMFFSETSDFYDQPQTERKRLMSFADNLVNSGRDATRYAAAIAISDQACGKDVTPVLSMEQRDALTQFRDANGRYWKRDLMEHWATGDYRGVKQAGLLQQVRNTFGPKWLKRFDTADEPSARSALVVEASMVGDAHENRQDDDDSPSP